MRNVSIICSFVWMALICHPLMLNAQQEAKQIKRLNRSLFEFRQEFLELKEGFLKKEKAWKQQQEQFELLIKQLKSENETAKKESKKLREQVEKFEVILSRSDSKKMANDVNDIARLIDVLLYNEIGEVQHTDTLILKLINRHDSTISKDLLLFYLAKYKYSIGETEFALGYYGNILTDFPESMLISKTIFEMSQIFGETGKDQEQKTLLLQLASQEVPDKYGKIAIKKLKSMGVDLPNAEQHQKTSMDEFPTEAKPKKQEKKKDDLNLDDLDFTFE